MARLAHGEADGGFHGRLTPEPLCERMVEGDRSETTSGGVYTRTSRLAGGGKAMRRILPLGWLAVALAVLAALLAGSAAGQPDLVVTVQPTQDLPDLSPVPLSVTLRNLGDVGSPSAVVLLAIDGNPTDPPLAFDPLAAGASATVETVFTLACGLHTATALADPDALIAESDESNNNGSSIVRVVPVPSFSSSVTHGAGGHTLSLDASASTGCRPLAFEWTVVPGGSTSGELATLQAPAGDLAVTLTVTAIADPALRASKTLALTITNNIEPWIQASIPQAPLTAGTPSGLVVNATDVDGSVVSYFIEMGDGFETTSPAGAAQHAYARAGAYTVVVTATDNLGSQNETFLEHTVLNRPPEARIAPASATGQVGHHVSFSGVLSSDPEDSLMDLAFLWSLGDGSTGVGTTVDHVYEQPGEYVVTLTVTDLDGATSNHTARVTVGAAAGPGGASLDGPLILVLVFAGSTVASFAYARSRSGAPAKRSPAATTTETRDPPSRSEGEEE